MALKIAVPDLVSNSYFPAIAAVELGCFAEQGYDATVELIFPVDQAYAAMRNGEIDFVAGSAHSALAVFPEWKGAKLLCAQAQGMYWFLVMRADLNPVRGDLSVVKGRRIGAAPWVEMGLRSLLVAGGIDITDDVTIAPVPGATGSTVNFGLMAAKALEDGLIDGFWANGMAAELAVLRGIGSVVLDTRRGDGPAGAFDYTFASLAASDRLIEDQPAAAAAAVRAVVSAQSALRNNPKLASEIGKRLFPALEGALIASLIERDLPYYDAAIDPASIAGMNAFCRSHDLLRGEPAFEDVVAAQFSALWEGK
ncbi:MAG: ABC transporter substrate-binding protein [Sphingobium sp.]